MKRKLIIGLANILFGLHLVFGFLLLIGWAFPRFQFAYLALLAIWMSCWIFLGYCPLTRWEFLLRRNYNPAIEPNREFVQYYMYKFFKIKISINTIFMWGVFVFAILVTLSVLTQ